MSTAAQKLWPDPPEPPRTRPVGPREQIAEGTRVYVEHDERAWRFDHWMDCGRFRFALLSCDVASCRELHVCGEHRLRVGA